MAADMEDLHWRVTQWPTWRWTRWPKRWPTWRLTKKMANMELDMVADMEVDKVANKVAEMF